MDPFNCRGLIIRSAEYKEKDRLLSVLTSDRGLITICAKGVAKPGSSLGFVSMPYMLCDFVVTVSHGYYYLKDASIIESNSKIMESLEQMTVAAHISSCLMARFRARTPKKHMNLQCMHITCSQIIKENTF